LSNSVSAVIAEAAPTMRDTPAPVANPRASWRGPHRSSAGME